MSELGKMAHATSSMKNDRHTEKDMVARRGSEGVVEEVNGWNYSTSLKLCQYDSKE